MDPARSHSIKIFLCASAQFIFIFPHEQDESRVWPKLRLGKLGLWITSAGCCLYSKYRQITAHHNLTCSTGATQATDSQSNRVHLQAKEMQEKRLRFNEWSQRRSQGWLNLKRLVGDTHPIGWHASIMGTLPVSSTPYFTYHITDAFHCLPFQIVGMLPVHLLHISTKMCTFMRKNACLNSARVVVFQVSLPH